jgi:hypothetical protein
MYYLRKMSDCIQGQIEYIKEKTQPHIELCGFVVVFWISKMVNIVADFFADCYREYDFVKEVVDKTKYVTSYTYNKMTNCKCEPYSNTWISSNIVVEHNTKPYHFYDTYTVLDDFDISRLHNYFIQFINNKEVTTKEELLILKGMDEHKKNEFYICRRVNTCFLTEHKLEYSSVHFLSVNYKHPNMDYSIPLLISKSWCVVENEILGYTHVLRALNYQSEPYIFDMDYGLEIIDSNIKVFQLRSDEYLKMGANGYVVESINSDSEKDNPEEPVEF